MKKKPVRLVMDSLSRKPKEIIKEVKFWEPSLNEWYVRYDDKDAD